MAFLVALVEAILRLNRVVHAPYYALFLVGPAANAVEIWWTSRAGAVTVEERRTGAGWSPERPK